ncbi:hypothetical protein ACSBR1_003079 [Camellia fascicularis]
MIHLEQCLRPFLYARFQKISAPLVSGKLPSNSASVRRTMIISYLQQQWDLGLMEFPSGIIQHQMI